MQAYADQANLLTVEPWATLPPRRAAEFGGDLSVLHRPGHTVLTKPGEGW